MNFLKKKYRKHKSSLWEDFDQLQKRTVVYKRRIPVLI